MFEWNCAFSFKNKTGHGTSLQWGQNLKKMFELNPICKRCTRHGNNTKQIKVEKLKKVCFPVFYIPTSQ